MTMYNVFLNLDTLGIRFLGLYNSKEKAEKRMNEHIKMTGNRSFNYMILKSHVNNDTMDYVNH